MIKSQADQELVWVIRTFALADGQGSIHWRELQFHDCPLGKQSRSNHSGPLKDA